MDIFAMKQTSVCLKNLLEEVQTDSVQTKSETSSFDDVTKYLNLDENSNFLIQAKIEEEQFPKD